MTVSTPLPAPLSAATSSKKREHREPSSYPAIPPIYTLLLTLPSIAAPFLPASSRILAGYPNAVQSLLPALEPLDTHLRELLPRSRNWTHELLTTLLLSARGPLAAEAKLGFLLGGLLGGNRVDTAARLLWAVGCWRASGYAGPKREEVAWMADGLLGGFHTPGRECDGIKLADGEMKEAVVWVGGRAWGVEVLRGGKVLAMEEIRAQIEGVVMAAEAKDPTNVSVAALSHRLPRELWAKAKSILDTDPTTKGTMRRLYSSLTTLCLEPYPLPTSTAAALDDIRGACHSPNRFADQTFGVVVYSDGRAGVTVDHTVADFPAGLETAVWISSLAAAATEAAGADVSSPPSAAEEILFPALQTRALLPLPQEKRPGEPDLFRPPVSAPLPQGYRDSIPRDIRSHTVRLPRKLQKQRLVDVALQLACQFAVGRDTPMTQGVALRGVIHARAEPVMIVTREGVEFCEALENGAMTAEMREAAFRAAVEARKERIKLKTFPLYRNLFLAPSLSVLPQSTELATVQAVLHVASGAPVDSPQPGTMVSFSGSSSMPSGSSVAAAVNTVTAESQLGITYIASFPKASEEEDGAVTVAFTATGTLWRRELEDVVRSFDAVWELVLEAALGDEDADELVPPAVVEERKLWLLAVP